MAALKPLPWCQDTSLLSIVLAADKGVQALTGGANLPLPKLLGAFLLGEQLPEAGYGGTYSTNTHRAIAEPVFMRVTESAHCSQATTQRCQAGLQHGGDTAAPPPRQQRQCRGQAGHGQGQQICATEGGVTEEPSDCTEPLHPWV